MLIMTMVAFTKEMDLHEGIAIASHRVEMVIQRGHGKIRLCQAVHDHGRGGHDDDYPSMS